MKGDVSGKSCPFLRRGPWTPYEDAVLLEYVRQYGEGNWNAVQIYSPLLRCGKSCRLRWANHLKPNLKKGAFTSEEERLIIELHSTLGNKWARMATHLPGRTDNEIKNFWNTRKKRRQRSGLPMYPPDIQQQLQHPQFPQNHTEPQFPSLLFSMVPPNPNPNLYFTMPMSPFSPSPVAMSDFSLPPLPMQYSDYSYSEMILGGLVEPPVWELELPLIQTPPRRESSISTAYSRNDELIGGWCPASEGNSGLLDAVLEESTVLARKRKAVVDKMDVKVDEFVTQNGASVWEIGECSNENLVTNFSSSHSSTRIMRSEEQLDDEMNSMDDDLMSLLNNFSAAPQLPELYSDYINISNGASSSIMIELNLDTSDGYPMDEVQSSPDQDDWTLSSVWCNRNMRGNR